MSIQVLQPYYRTEECLKEIKECLDSHWTGIGFKTVQFEDAWKDYTGLPYAHFVNSATSGLHLAVRILKDEYGWDDGDEIITTPFTFVSTNHAIKYERLTPRFADIDATLTLDPAEVIKLIGNRTRAVMFVGLGGNTGNLIEIADICKTNGLKLILDAAHMSGTRHINDTLGNPHVGFESDVSVYSFHSVKNLPISDGGMVCFNSEELDRKARQMSWLGINKDTFSRSSKESYKWKYDVEDVGFKYHGNSILAAVGLVGLKYLDIDNEYRRILASEYEHNGIKTPVVYGKCIPSMHLYQILVNDRDTIMNELNKEGIYPGVHYISNTNYKMYSYDHSRCANASFISDHILSLPLHLNLTMDDISDISKIIRRVLDEHGQ